MTSFQRIIRDLANLFAIMLIAGIFVGSAGLMFVITGGVSVKNYVVEQQQNIDFSESYEGIDEIKIELASADLIIRTGAELRVETNDGSIKTKAKKNELKIEEKGKTLSLFDDTTVILYLPDGKYYDKIEIEAGAGSVNIEKLLSKKLELDIGAGETAAQYINVTSSAEIDLGTGSFNIVDADINNLSLDVGVGKSYIGGDYTGRSKIDVGIGEFVLKTKSPLSSYTVKAETGIGEFTVGADRINGECTIGTGDNILEVSGGIGKVDVDFSE